MRKRLMALAAGTALAAGVGIGTAQADRREGVGQKPPAPLVRLDSSKVKTGPGAPVPPSERVPLPPPVEINESEVVR